MPQVFIVSPRNRTYIIRHYGVVATRYYGYKVTVIDPRNPTRSDGFNQLSLINHYMDVSRTEPDNLATGAKAEKYAKKLSKMPGPVNKRRVHKTTLWDIEIRNTELATEGRAWYNL